MYIHIYLSLSLSPSLYIYIYIYIYIYVYTYTQCRRQNCLEMVSIAGMQLAVAPEALRADRVLASMERGELKKGV